MMQYQKLTWGVMGLMQLQILCLLKQNSQLKLNGNFTTIKCKYKLSCCFAYSLGYLVNSPRAKFCWKKNVQIVFTSQKPACELRIDQSIGTDYDDARNKCSAQQKKINLLLQCNGMGEGVSRHRPIRPILSNGNRTGKLRVGLRVG